MAKQDPGQLIEKTRVLTAMSRNFCENARHAKEWSERLVERAGKNVGFGRTRRDRKRRRRLLAKSV